MPVFMHWANAASQASAFTVPRRVICPSHACLPPEHVVGCLWAEAVEIVIDTKLIAKRTLKKTPMQASLQMCFSSNGEGQRSIAPRDCENNHGEIDAHINRELRSAA